jgi:hypothetical protein
VVVLCDAIGTPARGVSLIRVPVLEEGEVVEAPDLLGEEEDVGEFNAPVQNDRGAPES